MLTFISKLRTNLHLKRYIWTSPWQFCIQIILWLL